MTTLSGSCLQTLDALGRLVRPTGENLTSFSFFRDHYEDVTPQFSHWTALMDRHENVSRRLRAFGGFAWAPARTQKRSLQSYRGTIRQCAANMGTTSSGRRELRRAVPLVSGQGLQASKLD